jgi:hypothetical protein
MNMSNHEQNRTCHRRIARHRPRHRPTKWVHHGRVLFRGMRFTLADQPDVLIRDLMSNTEIIPAASLISLVGHGAD